MSKTLNEDFLYYISEEGDYDLMIVCVCTLFFFCKGTFIEDLLSARCCSKGFTCIKSFNPHSSFKVRCFSIPIF